MKKLTRTEFQLLTTSEDTDYGIMLRTKTPICKYGQAYSTEEVNSVDVMDKYLTAYYPMYLTDLELQES